MSPALQHYKLFSTFISTRIRTPGTSDKTCPLTSLPQVAVTPFFQHTKGDLLPSIAEVQINNGWRVKKLDATSGLFTSFVYNGGGQLMEEYEGTTAPIKTQPTKEYVYGPSGMLAIVEGTDNSSSVGGGTETIQYLTPDHLGSPRLITDKDGAVINRRDFYPFGEEIGANIGGRMALGYGTDSIKQRFTGYFRDEETGLDFAQARYFSSAMGRFMSSDEFTGGPVELFDFAGDASNNPTLYADIATPQSLNKYQYCFNNPYRYTDPNGHEGLGDVVSGAADFIGGVLKGYASSSSFGSVGAPQKNDSTINRVGQVVGTAIAGFTGVETAAGGGIGTVLSGGTLSEVTVPVIAIGVGQVAGAASNAGRIVSTPLMNQANSNSSNGGQSTEFAPGGKAPDQVTPGTKNIKGEYTSENRPTKPEPYSAHYDQYGRQIGRTDYTAQPDPKVYTNPHHHIRVYGPHYGPKGKETGPFPGEHPLDRQPVRSK